MDSMNNYKNQLADELYKAVKELNECLNSPKLDAVLHQYEDEKDRQTGRTTILYMMDAYELGQREYKDFLMENLK